MNRSAPLPDGPGLLALERRARSAGTGLGPADLHGHWRFQAVWGKGSDRPNGPGAAALRALGARLEIGPGADSHALTLGNRVALGALELRFEGVGRLQGKRPLLMFQFDRLRLRLGERTLWERTLPPPAARRMPFFALIGAATPARGSETGGSGWTGSDGWLAARGRGGGLALWCREEPGSGGDQVGEMGAGPPGA